MVAVGYVGRGVLVGIEFHKRYRNVLKRLVDAEISDVEYVYLPAELIMQFEALCVESSVLAESILGKA